MADRQDIDALMIGALYGELDAAESARLDAHLSSHPEDRAALDGLERTRATVRENFAAMPAAEPPQSISAVLLQAAARQAPARRAAVEPAGEGLWSRFVAWARPMTMNPALVGAMALMLVGVTATTLWVRGGSESGERVRSDDKAAAQAARPAVPPDLEPPAAADSAPGAAVTRDGVAAGSGAGDGFGADLAGERREAEEQSQGLTQAPERARKQEGRGVVAMPDGKADKLAMPASGEGAAGSKQAAKQDKPTADPAGYIELDARDVAPNVKDAYGDADDESGADRPDTNRRTATAKAPAPEPKPVDHALEDWAKGAHSRLVKLVRDGKCPEAGRLGAEIKDRAPDYYAASVANDRAIRTCKQYIENQAKKKAEKDYKSRSQGNTVDLEAADSN